MTTAQPEIREIEQIVTKPEYKEPGDDDKFSHYVQKELLADAVVFGTPLTALCGKKWVPTRDASKFPVCPECKDIWEGFPEAPKDDD